MTLNEIIVCEMTAVDMNTNCVRLNESNKNNHRVRSLQISGMLLIVRMVFTYACFYNIFIFYFVRIDLMYYLCIL